MICARFRVSISSSDYGNVVVAEASADFFQNKARMSYLIQPNAKRSLFNAKLLRSKRFLARALIRARQEVSV